MKVSHWIILVLTLLGVFFLGVFYQQKVQQKTITSHQAEAIMGTIENVLRMTMVEQQISEVLTRRQFSGYNWDILSGKIIYKVEGKVAAGYDLEGIRIDMDSLNRRIIISGIQDPQLLYVESDVQFYDVREGLFFEFSENDYNELMDLAESELRRSAREGGILIRAQEQFSENLEQISLAVESLGWKLEIKETSRLPDHLLKSARD